MQIPLQGLLMETIVWDSVLVSSSLCYDRSPAKRIFIHVKNFPSGFFCSIRVLYMISHILLHVCHAISDEQWTKSCNREWVNEDFFIFSILETKHLLLLSPSKHKPYTSTPITLRHNRMCKDWRSISFQSRVLWLKK